MIEGRIYDFSLFEISWPWGHLLSRLTKCFLTDLLRRSILYERDYRSMSILAQNVLINITYCFKNNYHITILFSLAECFPCVRNLCLQGFCKDRKLSSD